MAKRVDPLKAKQPKQKKIAIGLSAMLVLVLAYQGPKTLKMLKGPSATATATAVEAPVGTPAPTTTPSTGAPVSPAAAGAPPAGAGSQPVVFVNSDIPVAAGEGQLLSFEQFESKDPFQQQVDVTTDGGSPAGTVSTNDPTAPDNDSQAGSEPASPGTDPSIPGSAENPPLSVGGMNGGSGSSGSGSSGSASVPSNPGPAPAAATTISVNGTVYTITVGTPFPADQPTFEVVSLAQDGKSVQIGVAGGSLAGGRATVKLTVGKPLTLQNTADGSRYKLELLTVEGAVPAASKG